MNPAISAWHKIERRLARFCECETVKLKYDTGIVSFTFDDVPRSACLRGSAILESHDSNGTFYVCGGRTGTGDFHTGADLLRLVNGGHELGCHGYGHRSYQSIGKAEILADIQQNRYFFEDLGCDSPQHFAYPYGHVSPSVKRILAQEFISSRGVQPGINGSTTDLVLLKSFPLYQHLWTETTIAKIIENNAKVCGLLIFFTHRVQMDPDEHDCSTDLLDFAVRTSLANGNAVMPVGGALAKGGFESNLKRPPLR